MTTASHITSSTAQARTEDLLRAAAAARPHVERGPRSTFRPFTRDRKRASVELNTVESMPLFASVPRRRRWHVARLGDEVGVAAGTELTQQGGYAREFFVLIEGTADVYRDGERIGRLEAGDFFGEVGLLGPRWERSATVVATSPMRLLVLARREFRELLFAAPNVAARIHGAALQRA
jgi:CRP-like cAMP-binding protein